MAAGLQVDPFARGIGADQDAEWLGRRLGVEGELDGLAAIGSGGSGENIDPLVDAIRVLQRLQQAPLQPSPRIFPLCEKDQPPVIPMAVRNQVGANPIHQPPDPGVGPGGGLLRELKHLVDRG